MRAATIMIKRMWAAAPVASVILALALSATAFFGVRAALHWVDRPPLMERTQPIAAWMTPRYIARAWGVPHHVVRDAIGAPDGGQRGMESLTQIANERGVQLDDLMEDVQRAITQFRLVNDPPVSARPGEGAAND